MWVRNTIERRLKHWPFSKIHAARRPALIPPKDMQKHQTNRTIVNIIGLNIYQATDSRRQDGLNGTGGVKDFGGARSLLSVPIKDFG